MRLLGLLDAPSCAESTTSELSGVDLSSIRSYCLYEAIFCVLDFMRREDSMGDRFHSPSPSRAKAPDLLNDRTTSSILRCSRLIHIGSLPWIISPIGVFTNFS